MRGVVISALEGSTDNNELTSSKNENPPPVSFLIVHHLPGEPRRRPGVHHQRWEAVRRRWMLLRQRTGH